MTRRRDPFAERGARRALPASPEPSVAPIPFDHVDLSSAVLVVASGRTRRDAVAGHLAAALAGEGPVLAVGKVPGCTHRTDVDAHMLPALIDLLDPSHVVLPEDGGPLSDLGRRQATLRGWQIAVRVVAWDGLDALCATNRVGLEARVRGPRLWLVDPRLSIEAPPPRRAVVLATPDLPPPENQGVTFLGIAEPDPATLALPDARFVVSAGAGVSDLELFKRFVTVLGATPGASRVLVDAGLMPRDRQVGASGETTAAEVYVALGISGAIQHLEGITECRHVVSVNTDPSCPMAARADLALVGDAAEVMRAVLERLEGSR